MKGDLWHHCGWARYGEGGLALRVSWTLLPFYLLLLEGTAQHPEADTHPVPWVSPGSGAVSQAPLRSSETSSGALSKQPMETALLVPCLLPL